MITPYNTLLAELTAEQIDHRAVESWNNIELWMSVIFKKMNELNFLNKWYQAYSKEKHLTQLGITRAINSGVFLMCTGRLGLVDVVQAEITRHFDTFNVEVLEKNDLPLYTDLLQQMIAKYSPETEPELV